MGNPLMAHYLHTCNIICVDSLTQEIASDDKDDDHAMKKSRMGNFYYFCYKCIHLMIYYRKCVLYFLHIPVAESSDDGNTSDGSVVFVSGK